MRLTMLPPDSLARVFGDVGEEGVPVGARGREAMVWPGSRFHFLHPQELSGCVRIYLPQQVAPAIQEDDIGDGLT